MYYGIAPTQLTSNALCMCVCFSVQCFNRCKTYSLTASPMFLDDKTNDTVMANKGVIPYSLYKNDVCFCRISSMIATKCYGPPILHEEQRWYYWNETYTYGPWPPYPKNVVPKEPAVARACPKVSFALEDSNILMDVSPIQTLSPNLFDVTCDSDRVRVPVSICRSTFRRLPQIKQAATLGALSLPQGSQVG